jgi:hypothetical protein
MAYVHSSILVSAKASAHESRPVQQLAVSFTAHDTLQSLFLARYPSFDFAMKFVEDAVKASKDQEKTARRIGEKAARNFIRSRVDDGITKVP